MSFILDALKKSENARQRQAGPALFEVKVVPPRRTVPAWVVVAGILLVIYGVVLSWMLLRPQSAPPKTVPREASPAAAVPTARAGASAATPATAAGVRTSSQISAATPTGKIAGPEPTRPAASVGTTAGAPVSARPVAAPGRSAPNPADLLPAEPPRASGQSGSGLPLYAQIAAAPGADLPRLHLDLHVYDQNPSKRFVMINMHKLRQGDSLADGVTVVKIRPDGVVLSYQGRKFLLPR